MLTVQQTVGHGRRTKRLSDDNDFVPGCRREQGVENPDAVAVDDKERIGAFAGKEIGKLGHIGRRSDVDRHEEIPESCVDRPREVVRGDETFIDENIARVSALRPRVPLISLFSFASERQKSDQDGRQNGFKHGIPFEPEGDGF